MTMQPKMLANMVLAFAVVFWFGFNTAAPRGAAFAAEMADTDGTFVILSEQTTSAGKFMGEASLKYKGEEHRFTIEGISASGVDTNHPVEGSIHHLKSLDDVNGKYELVKHEREKGMDVLHLRNEKGVEAIARGSNKGMELGIRAGGITVTLEK